MKPAFAPLALGLLASAAPSFALEFGNGFSLTGDTQLEYVSVENGLDSTIGHTDVTLGWRNQGASAFGLGFDLTYLGRKSFDGDISYDRLWGGLVLTTDFAEITVGRPRPLLTGLSKAPKLGTSDGLSQDIVVVFGSYLALNELYSPEIDRTGVSLVGNAGQFSYGAAIHHIDSGFDSGTHYELTAAYEADATQVYVGFEDYPDGVLMSPESRFLLGARYDGGRWTAGAEFNRADFGGGYKIDSYYVYGEYEVLENLTLGAQILDIGGTSDERYYGLSGIYNFGKGGFAELGYVNTGDFNRDRTTASVGFRF